MKRFLLVDNSNTRTKFATGTSEGLEGEPERVPTGELTLEGIEALAARFTFDAVVICSVVPDKAAVLQKALAGKPLHHISHRSSLPIGIDYPKPEQIGADRLANAVAAHALFGAPSIIIDFGTAVTFDVVGAPGSYLGGVITPGLSSMTTYLHRRTALLPKIDLAEPKSAIGKSTTEAMRAGAVIGYRGMIREILQAITRELGENVTVAATGGDATLIAKNLPEVGEIVPDLTLRGVLTIGTGNI